MWTGPHVPTREIDHEDHLGTVRAGLDPHQAHHDHGHVDRTGVRGFGHPDRGVGRQGPVDDGVRMKTIKIWKVYPEYNQYDPDTRYPDYKVFYLEDGTCLSDCNWPTLKEAITGVEEKTGMEIIQTVIREQFFDETGEQWWEFEIRPSHPGYDVKNEEGQNHRDYKKD